MSRVVGTPTGMPHEDYQIQQVLFQTPEPATLPHDPQRSLAWILQDCAAIHAARGEPHVIDTILAEARAALARGIPPQDVARQVVASAFVETT